MASQVSSHWSTTTLTAPTLISRHDASSPATCLWSASVRVASWWRVLLICVILWWITLTTSTTLWYLQASPTISLTPWIRLPEANSRHLSFWATLAHNLILSSHTHARITLTKMHTQASSVTCSCSPPFLHSIVIPFLLLFFLLCFILSPIYFPPPTPVSSCIGCECDRFLLLDS